MRRWIKSNSSLLLSVGAGVGVISTAYLAAIAGAKANEVLEAHDPVRILPIKEKARLVWRFYIPAAASGAATIVCVAGVKHVDARKTLAAQTALAVSQRAYESYREQVIEELGGKKDELFVAKAAEKRVEERPPPAIVAGSGPVLCCEAYTGRYFMCDMETINKAINDVNAKLLKEDYATLDDFYYLLHLASTTASGNTGWATPKMVELEFSSILHDGRPVLVFDYSYVTTL